MPFLYILAKNHYRFHLPTTFIGFPSMKAITLLIATSINRVLASLVAQAICGVIKAFSHFSSGLSVRGGSSLNTSAQ